MRLAITSCRAAPYTILSTSIIADKSIGIRRLPTDGNTFFIVVYSIRADKIKRDILLCRTSAENDYSFSIAGYQSPVSKMEFINRFRNRLVNLSSIRFLQRDEQKNANWKFVHIFGFEFFFAFSLFAHLSIAHALSLTKIRNRIYGFSALSAPVALARTCNIGVHK